MVLLVAEHLAAGQVDKRLWEGHKDRNPRLELLLVGFQCHCAVTEHDSTGLDIADRVHVILDLKLADALIRRLH